MGLWAWLSSWLGQQRDRAKLGRWGESVAQRFLQGLGYQPIARNWRSGKGELDLVMAEGRTIVFVEVKTRRSEDYYPAIAAVNAHKRKVLNRTAKRFLRQYKLSDRPLRFDVVTVIGMPDKPEIKHYRGAFVP